MCMGARGLRVAWPCNCKNCMRIKKLIQQNQDASFEGLLNIGQGKLTSKGPSYRVIFLAQLGRSIFTKTHTQTHTPSPRRSISQIHLSQIPSPFDKMPPDPSHPLTPYLPPPSKHPSRTPSKPPWPRAASLCAPPAQAFSPRSASIARVVELVPFFGWRPVAQPKMMSIG